MRIQAHRFTALAESELDSRTEETGGHDSRGEKGGITLRDARGKRGEWIEGNVAIKPCSGGGDFVA